MRFVFLFADITLYTYIRAYTFEWYSQHLYVVRGVGGAFCKVYAGVWLNLWPNDPLQIVLVSIQFPYIYVHTVKWGVAIAIRGSMDLYRVLSHKAQVTSIKWGESAEIVEPFY